MKHLYTLVILLLSITPVFAQTDHYKMAMDNFQNQYNNEDYDAIYHTFSKKMQQTLSLTSTKQFFTSLTFTAGKMLSKDFIEFEENGMAMYQVEFEKLVAAMNIILDENQKIDGLLLQPYAEEPETSKRNTINALNNYPEQLAQQLYTKVKDFPNNTQLSLAIVENGTTNYYGIIIENDSIKSTSNHQKVFEIGSITKVFTTTVLANLVQRNKLKLDDKINAYYPFSFKDNIQITFESLANHSSGLPRLPSNLELSNGTNPYKDYNHSKLEEYLQKEMILESDPQSIYSYSNLGAGLLGYTLGLSQKTTIQALLQKWVFKKYKMKNTYTNHQNLEHQLVKGLDEKGKITSNWDFDALFAAGGVLSTTEDLVKFAQAHFSPKNKELTLLQQPTFRVTNQMQIGLGWHILTTDNNKEILWHNGGTGGYSSSMSINIQEEKAVIILSNVSGFNKNMGNIDALVFELME